MWIGRGPGQGPRRSEIRDAGLCDSAYDYTSELIGVEDHDQWSACREPTTTQLVLLSFNRFCDPTHGDDEPIVTSAPLTRGALANGSLFGGPTWSGFSTIAQDRSVQS